MVPQQPPLDESQLSEDQLAYLGHCKQLRADIDHFLRPESDNSTSQLTDGKATFSKNGAFIKLCGRAASDARWMNHDLCCTCADDVFYLVKASKRIGSALVSA